VQRMVVPESREFRFRLSLALPRTSADLATPVLNFVSRPEIRQMASYIQSSTGFCVQKKANTSKDAYRLDA